MLKAPPLISSDLHFSVLKNRPDRGQLICSEILTKPRSEGWVAVHKVDVKQCVLVLTIIQSTREWDSGSMVYISTSTICQSANCVETLESKSMQLIQIWARKRLSPFPGFEPTTSMGQADVLPIELSRLGSLIYNYAIFVKVYFTMAWFSLLPKLFSN